MTEAALLVLVSSPLVGGGAWEPVGERLRAAGHEVLLFEPSDDGTPPYWRQHAASAVDAVASRHTESAVVLVGHSGAGPILPVIADALEQEVAAAVFVDAGLPIDGASRLDLLAAELPEMVGGFKRLLAAGGRYPQWSPEDLRDEVPDEALRSALVGDLRSRGEDFFAEPIPVPQTWQRVACAYLRLSAAYDRPADAARTRGWPVVDLDAGHFGLLSQPAAVAEAIVRLIGVL